MVKVLIVCLLLTGCSAIPDFPHNPADDAENEAMARQMMEHPHANDPFDNSFRKAAEQERKDEQQKRNYRSLRDLLKRFQEYGRLK